MNLDFKTLPAKLNPLIEKVKTYSVFICIIAVLGLFGFLVLRINQFTNAEPSEDALNEKLMEVKRPKIDQQAIEKIEELEERNVDVQTLFDEARDNPFQD